MKSLYVLVINEICENDKRKFFLNEIGTSNYDVKTVSLSNIVNKESLNEGQCDITIYNLEDFDKLIRENDYFLLLFNKTLRIRAIYNVLTKYSKKYIMFGYGRVAVKFCSAKTPIGFCHMVKKIIKRPDYLLDFLYRKFTPSIEIFSFGSGTFPCDVSVPSFEYDICQRLLETETPKEEYHVFLDQGLARHRDIHLSFRDNIKSPDNYYKGLNAFFDKLEKATGKKVKIALHPRTTHSSYNFGGREVFLNQTPELVVNADIVMGHYSTSIHYPIIFDKKMILIINDQMEMCDRYTYAEAFSDELDMPMLNVDTISELPDFDEYINKSRYEEYINKYIRLSSLKSDKRYTYEYINETLDKMIINKI